jgi:4-amino-4-deoxy-L-arabinose transferase-like glycosyltransferase
VTVEASARIVPSVDVSPAEPAAQSPFALVLCTVALLPRIAVAFAFAAEPVWDGQYYDFGARRIASGAGYSDDLTILGHVVWHPWCHYPVGYSAVLAAFYRILGAGPLVAPMVNAFTGSALALVTWALARRGLSEGRARAAGLIVALYPGLVLYSALVMTEPLAALVTLTAFWLAVRDSQPTRGLVVGALALGVAALVRPQALLCAPFLGLVEHGRKPRLKGALLACVVSLLPVLPWTARNCRVMDGCALVSTNAGWNLAIGSFPRATGRFETLHASDGCRVVTGQVQQDRCWLRYGLEQIEENPLRWLALVPAKLKYTFDHESFAVEYLHEARPNQWPEGRRGTVRDAMTLFERLLVCASALGLAAVVLRPRSRVERRAARAQGVLLVVLAGLGLIACREPPAFWPLVVFAALVPWLPLPGRAAWPAALKLPVALLATTVVTHAIFFGEDRYHMVVVPVLAILAAAALRSPAATSRNGATHKTQPANG